jgi:ATP-dependent DNA helicase PIF1
MPRRNYLSSVITKSSFWESITLSRLNKNMRLSEGSSGSSETAERIDFSKFILEVGEGKVPENIEGNISIPEKYLHRGNLEGLLSWVYNGINDNIGINGAWIAEGAILSPKDEEVHAINIMALEKPGEAFDLLSFDNNYCTQSYPVEFLNSFNPSGMPLHKLTLKVGTPIILLRNLDIKQSLSIVTRLFVTKIGRRVLVLKLQLGPIQEKEFLFQE